MSDHSLTLITVGDKDEATFIARQLVERQLVAGVQIIPIESVYSWQNEIVEDGEFLLIAKARKDRFSAVQSAVEALHSYEVPPIVMIDIDQANRPYLDWIDGVLGV